MSNFQKIRLMVAAVLLGIAALFLVFSVYFTFMYFIDKENSIAHEYLIGTWLGLLYATAFSLGSAMFAASVKAKISRLAFRLLSMPALFLSLSFLVIYFGSVVFDLASRT